MNASTDPQVLEFMGRALEIARGTKARGNPGVAAVIVKDGHIIGEGFNREGDTGDPFTHAEMEALRDVIVRHGRPALIGALCVVTMEPCPMCASALIMCGLAEVAAGARHVDLKPGRYGTYRFEDLATMMNSSVRFSAGTLRAECAATRLPL